MFNRSPSEWHVIMMTDELLDDFVSKYGRSVSISYEHNQRWYAKYLRDFVKHAAYLCRLNFKQNLYSIQSGTNSNVKSGKKPFWSDMLYYFCQYFMIKMMIVIYNQYEIDYHKYKLDKFDMLAHQYNNSASEAWSPPQGGTIEKRIAFRLHLINQYEQALNASKLFDAPHLINHMNFIAENILIYLLIVIPTVYLCPQLYYKYYRQFDYSIMYTIIAFDKSQASVDSVICATVNRFITSSEVFRERLLRSLVSEEAASSNDRTQEISKYANYTQSANNHKYLVEQVKAMALNGMLQPYNRREDWLAKVADIYYLSFFGIIGLLVTATILFLAVATLQLSTSDNLSGGNPMDILFYMELYLYDMIGVMAAAFYVSNVVAMCFDQVYEVSQLNRTIDSCIVINRCRIGHLLGEDEIASYTESSLSAVSGCHGRPHQQRRVEIYDYRSIDCLMNTTLVYTLLHYKIFVKQIKPAAESVGPAATILVFILFLPLLSSRIMIAYLNTRQRLFTFCFTLLILAIVLVFCAIICWFYARCSDIYTHLHSLIAHTIFMDQMVKSKFGRGGLYDRHLIWMLRSELSDPERLIDQYFMTQPAFGLSKLTYGMLIQCIFWWGMLAISFLMVDSSSSESSDLFGRVWKFYSSADTYIERFFEAPQAMFDINGTIISVDAAVADSKPGLWSAYD